MADIITTKKHMTVIGQMFYPEYGIKIIRYSNNDIEYGLTGVIKDFNQQIKIREQELR